MHRFNTIFYFLMEILEEYFSAWFFSLSFLEVENVTSKVEFYLKVCKHQIPYQPTSFYENNYFINVLINGLCLETSDVSMCVYIPRNQILVM